MLSLVLAAVIISGLFNIVPVLGANTEQLPLYILLNDSVVESDVSPYIDDNNRTMVPVKFISEALGALVEWDDATRTVTVIKGNDVMTLAIGSNELIKNGEVIIMDSAAVIKESRTFVPVRYISEALALTVGWDEASRTVILNGETEIAEPSPVDYGYGKIPAFSTTDMNGNTVTEAIFDEKPITFINYWATWCGPCRNELPEFQGMYDKYKDKVQFITVVDDGENNQTANQLIDSYLKDYVNLLPESGLVSELSSGYVPTSIIVGYGGYIIGGYYNDDIAGDGGQLVGSYGDYSSFLDAALKSLRGNEHADKNYYCDSCRKLYNCRADSRRSRNCTAQGGERLP
jgi:thiol-disulfide isomerase/thioredoxin